MSIQKFPLATIQKIRQYIKSGLVLPESERNGQGKAVVEDVDLPEPESLDALGDLFGFGGMMEPETTMPSTGEWFVSKINPAAVLLKLPGLSLKPEFRMVSYLYRAEGSGYGKTWAVPEFIAGMAQLEKAIADNERLDQPPQPEGALSDFMSAIEGDRTPASFVVASLLRRELLEVGAVGPHCDWTHHRLIEAVPSQLKWQWKTEQPKDLSPKVRILPDGQAAVELFTCRVVAPVAIFRHLDQYMADSYRPNSASRPIAIAQR